MAANDSVPTVEMLRPNGQSAFVNASHVAELKAKGWRLPGDAPAAKSHGGKHTIGDGDGEVPESQEIVEPPQHSKKASK